MFFTELDCYVDGGVLANNPCESGLTKIQEFFYEQKRKLPISLILSVGAGKLPEDELGKTDAQEFLFFGKHWFDFSEHIGTRAANLTTLLGNAVRTFYYAIVQLLSCYVYDIFNHCIRACSLNFGHSHYTDPALYN